MGLCAPKFKIYIYFWKWSSLASYFFLYFRRKLSEFAKQKTHCQNFFDISRNGYFSSFRRELAKPENQNFSYVSFHFFCLLRENFSNANAKEKEVPSTFSYEKSKFSKLK